MVEALGGSGVRTSKVRGGMAKLGATRIFGTFRFGNMLARWGPYDMPGNPTRDLARVTDSVRRAARQTVASRD